MTNEVREDRPAFDAFISYSRTPDADLSETLQRALQRFAKPWYRRRALRVFRDATALTPDASLPAALESAINQAAYFILLASPESASSIWVQREVEHWCSTHGVSRILLVLTGGSLAWSESAQDFDRGASPSLPPQLFGAFDAEPLYVDLSTLGRTADAKNPQLVDAVATLASVIHRRPKDELIGEDLSQHRRTLRTAWGAATMLGALAIATSVVSVWAIQQRDIAEARERQARAAQLASDANRILSEQPDQIELAALLAIESVKREPSGGGQRALANASRLLPGRVSEHFGEQVEVVALSADKRWLASGDGQFGVMVWDLQSGESGQLSLPGEVMNQLQVRDLAFSRDNRWLAIASGANNARVYDLPDGERIRTFEHADAVMTVAFDPAGNRLATGGKDGYVRVWDLESEAMLFEEQIATEQVLEVGFSPDGNQLGAVASNGPFRLLDTGNWQRIELEQVTPGEGFALAFSPDNQLFAVTRANRAVVWSRLDGRVITTVEHSDFVGDAKVVFGTHVEELLFSPDSRLLVTSSRDRTTRFWRADTGEEVRRLTHQSPAEHVVFTADGSRVATATYGLVQLWSMPEGNEVLRVANDGGNAMALSDDGVLLAAAGPNSSLRVMHSENAVTPRYLAHDDDVVALGCHPDQPLIATADDDHNASIWDAVTGNKLATTNQFGSRHLRFGPTDDLFVGAQSTLVRLGVSGEVQTLVPRYAYNIALHRDHAAARMNGGHVLLWSTDNIAEPLRIDADAHNDIRFNRSGTLLLTQRYADKVGTIHAWDVTTGAERWSVELDSAFGSYFDADDTGETAIVADQENLTVTDIATGAARVRPIAPNVRAMLLVADGTRVALLFKQELVQYDLKTLEPVAETLRHDDAISAVTFNPDRQLAATTTGRDLAIWNLEDGARLAEWTVDSRVSRMCFLAGDEALVTGDQANMAMIRPWRTSGVSDAVCSNLTRNLSEREWATYLPGLPYERTCPDLKPIDRAELLEQVYPASE